MSGKEFINSRMESNSFEIDPIKLLVTTALEETWGDDEEIVFLAEWCQRYEATERWSTRKSELLDYHWGDRKKLARDNEYLEPLHQDLIKSVSVYLNRFHNTSYPPSYWRIIVGPWLLNYVSIIWDRWEAIRSASEKNQNFISYVFKDIDRCPADDYQTSLEMMIGSDKWNHVILREILLFQKFANISLISIQCPESVRLNEVISPKSTSVVPSKDTSNPALKLIFGLLGSPFAALDKLIASLKRVAINSFQRFTSLFAGVDREVLLYHTYFHKFFLLKLSFILKILPAPARIFEQKIEYPLIKTRNYDAFTNFKHDCDFEKFLSLQIIKDMPIAYLEGYSEISKIRASLPSSKIIFTANAHFHNEIFKSWAAENIFSRNSKLFISSHGGAFYPLFSVFNHQEKIAEKRVVWGRSWAENQLTLPPNKLHFKVKKYLKSGAISMFHSDSWRYPHRLVSMPMGPCQMSAFRLNQKLLCTLNPEIRKLLKIRPNYQGDWLIHQRYYDEFGPEILAERVSLIDQIKASRLIICTYPQTTFSEAMFSGVPTMLFYKENLYETQPIYDDLIKMMKDTKIIHTDPEQAANHLLEIHLNPMRWWNSPATVQARQMFETICITPSESPFNKWRKFFHDQKSKFQE